jgi:glutathione S-transferase
MIRIYGHPFAAFAWKALIAAHARGVDFEFRIVSPDDPEASARIAELSPTGQFPALTDGARGITGSNAVIAYLDTIGPAPPLVPDGEVGRTARMMADVYDDYVAAPMQRITGDALRPEAERDPRGVRDARDGLIRAYRWLEPRVGTSWAAGDAFSIADCAAAPALFYADWVEPIPGAALRAYRARLLAHPAVARVVDAARPYRPFFPLGAPDRD